MLVDVSGRALATKAERQVLPSLVNCVAAWNYCAFPRRWLQRSHTDPHSGDLLPALDAVAEKNNVRTTTDSVTDFVAHNASLGALTVFRTERLFDAKTI